MKRILNISLFICFISLFLPPVVSAQIPYTTWYIDPNSYQPMAVQPIYVPKSVIDGNRLEIPLLGPTDLFITDEDHAYIADTGNNRIVELDGAGEYIRSIGTEEGRGALNQPEGVFVDREGTIYVANTGDRSIVKFDADGEVLQVFAKPESNLLYEDYHFLPTKLVVDARGVMYIAVKNSYQGLMRLTSEGEFSGFYGANKAKLTWMDRLKRMIQTKQQLAKAVAIRPNSIENITLAPDGFLITTSSGDANDGQIKKLNAGGADAFKNKEYREKGLADIAVDAQGFLYGIDRLGGFISLYDPTAEAMFYFSQKDNAARQSGIVSLPTSIAINNKGEIWVADSSLSLIHVFERTPFGETFLTAAHLYFEGEYEESKSYWAKIIRENGMINLAFNGLGKVALHEKEYAAAMNYFMESYDTEGYSDAYWNVRYEWLKRNLLILATGLVVGFWLIGFLLRKWRAYARNRTWHPLLLRYGSEIKDAFYLIFHPYEGFYRIKERKISFVVIAFILALAIGVHVMSIFASGFIAYPNIARVNINLVIALMAVPWITWVIANYLVSTVKGGEGRIWEVLQASTFALVPFIVIKIPIMLLSNVIVLEEWVIIDILNQIMWLWIILLFFVMTQVTHNFDFMETIRIIGTSLFTIVVIWVFIAIMAGLSMNLLDFMQQVYREVTAHG